MGHRAPVVVPAALRPLLERPQAWPAAAWRVSAAACRASGLVAWAARVEPPSGDPFWIDGRTPSRPNVIQSECVDALIAALRATPAGAAVEIVAPTSLRYLAEGVAFPSNSPERQLYELGRTRLMWARYAVGDLEQSALSCLRRAFVQLAPVRWPGEAALDGDYALYADGGCAPSGCACAWVLRRQNAAIGEQVWAVPGPTERDAVRLAEFLAVAEGLAAVPAGSSVAVVTDHADVSDFGVRGVPAFRPSPRVRAVLSDLLRRAAARQVRWYWAPREDTPGQRRCQALINRRLRAADARARFLATCREAGLQRVYVPDFEVWLAPREPVVLEAGEQWAATFEPLARYLSADPRSPRVYVRQLELHRREDMGLLEAFTKSRAAGWCVRMADQPPLGEAASAVLGWLRNGFPMLALLFEPDVAVLVQTRPGATLEHVLDAASTIHAVDLT